jgi:chromosome segregation ATPase
MAASQARSSKNAIADLANLGDRIRRAGQNVAGAKSQITQVQGQITEAQKQLAQLQRDHKRLVANKIAQEKKNQELRRTEQFILEETEKFISYWVSILEELEVQLKKEEAKLSQTDSEISQAVSTITQQQHAIAGQIQAQGPQATAG